MLEQGATVQRAQGEAPLRARWCNANIAPMHSMASSAKGAVADRLPPALLHALAAIKPISGEICARASEIAWLSAYLAIG
jgi:hypothetical protein